MNGRVYDPNLGRFLSMDPVFEFPTNTQSLNPYSYVLNNPLSLTDPTGYQAANAGAGSCGAANNCASQGYGQSSGESSRIAAGHRSATEMKFHAGVRALGKFAKQAKGILGKALSAIHKYLVTNGANAFEGSNDEQNKSSNSAGIGSPKHTGKQGWYFTDAQNDQLKQAINKVIGMIAPEGAVGDELVEMAGKELSGTATKIVAKDGTEITGLTKHGVNRVIGDAGSRAGTKPDAMLDAIRNPTKVTEGTDRYGRPYKMYTGKNARVIINPDTGKVISTNPLSGAGAH